MTRNLVRRPLIAVKLMIDEFKSTYSKDNRVENMTKITKGETNKYGQCITIIVMVCSIRIIQP